MKEIVNVKILHLPLKAKWYEMQERGEKTEEYRNITPYWTRRICGCKGSKIWCQADMKSCAGCVALKNQKPLAYTHVLLRYGYTKRCMIRRIDSITIGRGNPEWGAPTDRDVYIIRHHKEESPIIKEKEL